MPGKGAKERRKKREAEAMADFKKRESAFLSSGGEKICKHCFRYGGCPVGGDEVMPCWGYDGNSEVVK